MPQYVMWSCKTIQLRPRENLLMVGKIFPACPVVEPASGGFLGGADSVFVLGVGEADVSLNLELERLGDRNNGSDT